MENTKVNYVGNSMERHEDATLLTGRGRFVDDFPVRKDTLFAAVVRSPHAHAKIVSIDINSALASPEVAAVLTGKDIQELSDPFLVVIKQPINQWSLAVDKVRYVGEPVALILAADRYKAEDAADLISIEYDPLPVAIDPKLAAKDGPLLFEEIGSNVVSSRHFSYGQPERAFSKADHIIEMEIEYPRNSLTPIECFAVLAEYSSVDHTYDVLANFQGPYTTHPVMARALRVPGTGLRLRTPADSGGSFGVKQSVFPYIVLMALGARKTGKPVKWIEDRFEHLTAGNSAPNRVTKIKAGVLNSGKVVALSLNHLDDYGAYLRSPMPGPIYRMHGASTGAYDIRHLLIDVNLVLTNKMPAGLVRGFGGPQLYFALERLMHRVSKKLQIDPLKVIKRNLIPADSFPYRAAAGGLYDSGNYEAAIELAVDKGNLEDLVLRKEKARQEGRLYGIGYAAVVEPGMSNLGYLSTILTSEERRKTGPKNGAVSIATVSVDPLGSVAVTADSTPQGQGHATVLSQIVADELGLKPADVRTTLELDTNKDPWSIAAGAYSCRFTPGTAVAAKIAAQKIKERLIQIAAPQLNVSAENIVLGEGKIYAADNPDNAIKFNRAAGAAHWAPGTLPEGTQHGLHETGVWSPPELDATNEKDQTNTSLTYGFVFDYCGVEIDNITGRVRIDKYVTTHDSGKLLNPMIAEGQIFGAFSQGVGAALYEEFVYGMDGSFLSGTFSDYLVPTIHEIPEPLIFHIETPTPFTPLGAKGVAEGNCMSTPVCLANAVADALEINNISLPLTPEKLSAIISPDEAPPSSDANYNSTPSSIDRKSSANKSLVGSGVTSIPGPISEIWSIMFDSETLSQLIPGCEKLDIVGENEYLATVSLGVGPVRGKFVANVSISDLVFEKSGVFYGTLSGPLGASTGKGLIRLEEIDENTLIKYEYSISISGKVAAVGSRMLDSAARLIVRSFFEKLATKTKSGVPKKPSLLKRLFKLLRISK